VKVRSATSAMLFLKSLRKRKIYNGDSYYIHMIKKRLERLGEIEKELTILGNVEELFGWDQLTLMPKKAVKYRAEQVAYISKLIHEKRTSKELKKIIFSLSKPKNFKKLGAKEKIIVKKYKKEIKKWIRVPKTHVEEFSRLTSKAEHAWEKAKQEKKFKIFEPYLKKIVDMKIKEAKYIDSKKHPYDVLLDDFEEGMTIKKLDDIFYRLKEGIIEILNHIKNSKRFKQQKNILKKEFSVEKQEEASKQMKEILFLNEDQSVLGISTHPFTTSIAPDDVRFTTRYFKKEPLNSLMGVVHESGHALYELGYDRKYEYTILFTAPSFGLHESQSRFWENQICRGKAFWDFYFLKYKKIFRKELKNVGKNEFYRFLNTVKPSLIRVEADEVTYCLHIIIRYELERALIEKKLKVKDLQKEWNKKYKEYLGVVPKNPAEGVLQDMHWSSGWFCYFPTYAIGTMYAAMLFKQLKKEKGNVEKDIAKGNLKPILEWLKKNVHRKAATKLADEIVKDVCGSGLNEKDFLDYLKEKYYGLYK